MKLVSLSRSLSSSVLSVVHTHYRPSRRYFAKLGDRFVSAKLVVSCHHYPSILILGMRHIGDSILNQHLNINSPSKISNINFNVLYVAVIR